MRGVFQKAEIEPELADQDWFRELPGEVQDIVRARQEREDAHLEELDARVFARRKLELVKGCVMIVGVEALVVGMQLALLPLWIAFGVLNGYVWGRFRTGPLLSLLLAMPGYFALKVATGWGMSHLPLVGTGMVGFLAAYLGYRRELSTYE